MIKSILLPDQRKIYGYQNIGVIEQKRYSKGGFKTAKDCDILKLLREMTMNPPKTLNLLFEATGVAVNP